MVDELQVVAVRKVLFDDFKLVSAGRREEHLTCFIIHQALELRVNVVNNVILAEVLRLQVFLEILCNFVKQSRYIRHL